MVFKKNYYNVLGLDAPSPSRNSSTSTASVVKQDELRKAYRKALLGAHPDKANAKDEQANIREKAHNGAEEVYTVDDVKEAFGVLGDVERKGEYDAWLKLQEVGHKGLDVGGVGGDAEEFILGLEVLDLGDFEVECVVDEVGTPTSTSTSTSTSSSSSSDKESCGEDNGNGGGENRKEGDGDAEQMQWTRSCRCGADKGFRIREEELEDAERRGEKEVLVGCEGCSLWVRVGFEVEDG